MKKLIVFIGVIMISCAAQPKIISEIQKFQEELNMEYKNPKDYRFVAITSLISIDILFFRSI